MPIQRYANLPTLDSALMDSEELAPAHIDDPLREMALKLRAAEDALHRPCALIQSFCGPWATLCGRL